MAGLSAAAVPIETQGGAQVQGSETPVVAVSGRADIRFIDQGDGTRCKPYISITRCVFYSRKQLLVICRWRPL